MITGNDYESRGLHFGASKAWGKTNRKLKLIFIYVLMDEFRPKFNSMSGYMTTENLGIQRYISRDCSNTDKILIDRQPSRNTKGHTKKKNID